MLNAKISLNGNLEVYGNTGQTFEAKASYVHRWNPNQYFPAQVDDLIKKETESRFPGISFEDLPQSDQELVRFAVFSSDRIQETLDSEAK